MTTNINDNIPTPDDLASFHRKLTHLDYVVSHKLLAEFVEVMRTEMLDVWENFQQLENPTTPAPVLKVKLLSPNAKVPTRGSEGAIGWDLYSNEGTKIIVPPCSRLTLGTSIAVAIPSGYYGRVAPRSGLAAKQGIDILAGVIDSDYRGEVKVIMYNTTTEFQILDLTKPIAQLILERADAGVVMVVEDLDETERGSGGFGSTDQDAHICSTCMLKSERVIAKTFIDGMRLCDNCARQYKEIGESSSSVPAYCKHERTSDGVCLICGEDYRQWGGEEL